jgi:AmmeMemoRadiSam system protein B
MKLLSALLLSIISLFSKPIESNIKGIILPHHDLAKPIFHESLEKVKKVQYPSTIVIYGTNHYYPIGPIFTTTNEIKNELNLKLLVVNNDRIKKEHSIQTLLPYLNDYFPKSKIIPIIIGTEYDLSKINELGLFLTNTLPKDTLYIASVDFSHNSNIESGLSKNIESIDSISKFNYQKVQSYHDDHLDSPVAITTFMKTMEILNAKKWETWSSSHGGLITNTPNLIGTSYVVGIFK